MHGGVDLLGKGMDLPAAGAVDENEIVIKGCDARHVEDHNVMALMIDGSAGTETSTFQSDPLRRSGRFYPGHCDIQRTSFKEWAAKVEVRVSYATWVSVAVGHLLTVRQQIGGSRF